MTDTVPPDRRKAGSDACGDGGGVRGASDLREEGESCVVRAASLCVVTSSLAHFVDVCF